MKKVNIISTVVQRQISGEKIPTGNNVTLNDVVDIDEIRKELSKNFISFDEFKSYWEIKTDAYGNKYIYSPLHIATQNGITMYANEGGIDIPTILNSIPTAGYDDIQARGLIAFNSKHFVINNGVVSAIQGSAGLDEEQLGNYLKNNHYATEDWVKEYIVEINTGETVNITKQMVIDALEYTPYDASNPNEYITSATLDGYLPLTGGAINGALSISGAVDIDGRFDISEYIQFTRLADGKTYLFGQPYGVNDAALAFYDGGSWRRIIHGGNIGSQSVSYATSAGSCTGNAASATKLSDNTSYTIWGQEFFVNGKPKNVSGDISLNQNAILNHKEWKMLFDFNDCLLLGHDYAINGLPSYIRGYKLYLQTGRGLKDSVYISETSNVGLGTTDPSAKLHVYGGATPIMCESNTSESSIYFVGTGTDSEYKWAIGKGVWGTYKKFGIGEYNTAKKLFVQINTNGYVGIGVPYTASPSEMLHVNGNILSTGGITTNASLTINGINIRKSQDGVLYLDGNLVVKGGVTMYGTDATSAPSILDSLPIASTSAKGIAQFSGDYFTVSDGIVRIIDGSVGLKESELNAILDGKNYATKTDLGNYLTLDANAVSATKLSDNTSYTIWGQEFFVNGKPKNVSGDISLNQNAILNHKAWKMLFDFNDCLLLGHDYAINGLPSYIRGYKLYLQTGRGLKDSVYISETSNVGIGTTSPSSKLHVYGNVKAENGNFIGNLTGTASNAEKFAGVDFATFVSRIPTNTNQLDNGAGFITSSGYSAGVVDYYSSDSKIRIGYQSSSLTASQIDYIAAYSEASNGDIVIKDVDKSTMQSWLGLGSLAYKSSLVASDIPSLDWSKITSGKPTTISGYGITDAITTSNIGSQSVNYATSSGTCTGNAASATKLSDNTSYTIWGQEFFVNGKPKNVSGDISLNQNAILNHKEWKMLFDTNDCLLLGHDYAINGLPSYIRGYKLYLQTGRGLKDSVYISETSNVGIGTTSPAYPLDVNGTVRASDYRFKRGTDGADTMSLYSPSNTTTFALENRAGAGSILFSLNVGGSGNKEVGKFNGGDGTFEVKGNALIGGGITMYSQLSLKDVVDERGLSLSELSTIKPTRYTWKDGRDNKIHIGGIADDIQQVLPEVVYKTEEGVLTMDYGNAGFAIAASLIKPVVDHEQRIKALEKENELLKQELNRLRA